MFKLLNDSQASVNAPNMIKKKKNNSGYSLQYHGYNHRSLYKNGCGRKKNEMKNIQEI